MPTYFISATSIALHTLIDSILRDFNRPNVGLLASPGIYKSAVHRSTNFTIVILMLKLACYAGGEGSLRSYMP